MVFDDDMVLVDRGRDRQSPAGPPDVSGLNLGGSYSEVEIEEEEMPEAVAAKMKELYPTGVIHEVKRETRAGGRIVYAIEVFVDGKQYDVEATADGEVLRNEAD